MDTGSASIGLEQAILGHTLGFAPMTSPTQVYVALCLASQAPSETVRGVEPFGGGYARMPATFALIAGPSNIAANTTSIEFPQAQAAWGDIGFFELWDAPVEGNRLYWGQLVSTADFTTPLVIAVSAGDITRFSAGTLGVQAATGVGGTASIGAYLPLAGGTMAGPLLLAGDPVALNEAATKSYVDAHSGAAGGPGFLPLSGGTMLAGASLGFAGSGTITGFGTAIGQALGPLVSSGAGNLPMLSTTNRLIFRRQNPAAGDNTDFQFDRTTTFTGGTLANINRVMGVFSTQGAGDGTQTAGIIAIATTNSTAHGYSLPLWVQSIRKPGSNGWIWGSVISSDDQTGMSSGTSGASNLAGIELDMGANRADDATNPATYGGVGNRKAIHVALSRSVQSDATPTEYSTGLWFSTNSTFGGGAVDTAITMQQVIGFQPGMSIRQALDTRGAVPPTGSADPVAAVRTSPGHIIDFNGGPALNSAPGNYLQYTTSGTPRLRYMDGAAELWAISDTGRWSGSSFGMGIGQIPVWTSYNAGTIPSWQVGAIGQGLQIIRTGPSSTDQWDLRLRRENPVVGGAGANVNANLRIDTLSGVADANQNASLLIVNKTNSNVSGLSPALWVQATRQAGSNAYISTGVFTYNDQTGLSSGTGTGNAATEVDLLANRADDGLNADTFGGVGLRKLVHYLIGRSLVADTTQTEVTTGLWFGTTTNAGPAGADPYTNYGQIIGFSPGTQVRQALDTRGAVAVAGSSDPVAAVRTSAGHIIDFNGGPALNSPPGNYLQYTTTGTPRLRYMAGGVERWSVSDTGTVSMPTLPTSNAGLAPGTLWNNGGFVCVA